MPARGEPGLGKRGRYSFTLKRGGGQYRGNLIHGEREIKSRLGYATKRVGGRER